MLHCTVVMSPTKLRASNFKLHLASRDSFISSAFIPCKAVRVAWHSCHCVSPSSTKYRFEISRIYVMLPFFLSDCTVDSLTVNNISDLPFFPELKTFEHHFNCALVSSTLYSCIDLTDLWANYRRSSSVDHLALCSSQSCLLQAAFYAQVCSCCFYSTVQYSTTTKEIDLRSTDFHMTALLSAGVLYCTVLVSSNGCAGDHPNQDSPIFFVTDLIVGVLYDWVMWYYVQG